MYVPWKKMEFSSEIMGETLIFWLGLLWKSDRAMFYFIIFKQTVLSQLFDSEETQNRS